MFLIKNDNLKKYIFFIFITILSCIYIYFFLYFERRVLGISSTYHPDSVYYYSKFTKESFLSFNLSIFENISGFFNNFFNNLLYPSILNLIFETNQKVVSISSLNFFHNTFYRYIINFNILFHLLLNYFILNYYFKKFEFNSKNLKYLFFLIIIIFLPYRCHLTVNILKDSLILFGLVIFLTYQNIFTLLLSFVMATPLRFGAIIYFILFINHKKPNKKILIPLILLILFVIIFLFFRVMHSEYTINYDELIISIKQFLKSRNAADLGGRTFDEVPSFFEYKTGSLIRAITWPFILLTGTFSFFSSSFLFYYLAAEVLFIQILFYVLFRKSIISINLIIVLMIIAVYTNTFTSYFRYSYLALYISILTSFFNLNLASKLKKLN